MPGDVRHEDPETYYLLSNRTTHGEFLFRPDDECVRICRGVLAWAAHRHEPKLAAFNFLSNHFHIVASFPDQNRGPFMRDFQGELASRIKKHRGRGGDDSTVFPRRYHCEALLDGEALLDAISYTANNAVRHGLVTHPGGWPGADSMECHRSGEPLVGHWLDYNHWYNLSRQKNPPARKKAYVRYTYELTVPSELRGRGDERHERLCERLESDRKEMCEEHGLERHLRVGPKHYKRVRWQTRRPIKEEWASIRRLCWSQDSDKIAYYLQWRREIDEDYRRAANRWKKGQSAVFPKGTYPPGRARCVEEHTARAPPDEQTAA